MIAIDPQKNRLLGAFPATEWERFQGDLERVNLSLGQVIYESGMALDHVYFPTSCIVSLIHVMQDGASAEIAVVGKEGMVGVSLLLGARSTPTRAVVQSAGLAYRIDSKVILDEALSGSPALFVMLRYTQALISQMTQTAACNRHHTVVSNCAVGFS